MPRRHAISGLLCALLAALTLAPAATAAGPTGFTAPDSPAVTTLITSLRGCLKALTPADRQLLTLRAGLGGRPAKLTAELAAQLQTTPAATNAAEITAIRRLETQRRLGACKPQATARTKPASKAATTKPAAATTLATASSDDGGIGVFGVIVPVLLIGAFVAGISLELRRQRRRPGQSLR